jgi:hypothetical protein
MSRLSLNTSPPIVEVLKHIGKNNGIVFFFSQPLLLHIPLFHGNIIFFVVFYMIKSQIPSGDFALFPI